MVNGSIHAVGPHSELLKTTPSYKEFFETSNQGISSYLSFHYIIYCLNEIIIGEASNETTQKPEQNGAIQNGTAKTDAKGAHSVYCILSNDSLFSRSVCNRRRRFGLVEYFKRCLHVSYFL
jgi:hypothetical protein